jgi:UDP-N-acetyl-D-mannosaminuronate dehydrogenase
LVNAEDVETASIKVSHAVKLIENIQREGNFALIISFQLVAINCFIKTAEMIDRSLNEMDFKRFSPGLVSGYFMQIGHY